MERFLYERTGPYRLNNTQELYRFGYRNYKHKAILVAAGFIAFIMGALTDSAEKALMDVLLV